MPIIDQGSKPVVGHALAEAKNTGLSLAAWRSGKKTLQRYGQQIEGFIIHHDTGTGSIHAFNQRIQSALQARRKEFPDWWRPIVAAFMLLASLGISTFGLISLVAKGYGSVSWGIFAIFFIPLVTRGSYLINRRRSKSLSRSFT